MPRCVRCNRYLIRKTQNGVCSNCEEFVKRPEELKKKQANEHEQNILSSMDGQTLLEKYKRNEIDGNVIIDAIHNHMIGVNCKYIEDENIETLLCLAIMRKDHELIDCLIENMCDVNLESVVMTELGKNYRAPLHYAVETKDISIVSKLIKAGASIEKKSKCDMGEMSLLSFAAYACDVDMLKLLLSYGADPNGIDGVANGESTPLDNAIRAHRYDNAQALIDAGADVDYVMCGEKADYTVLNWTIMSNDVEGFDLLMKSHANPNCVRSSHMGGGDNPALCDAVSEKRYDMVVRLIEAGARKDSVVEYNGRRYSLIELAKLNHDNRMITILYENGIYE